MPHKGNNNVQCIPFWEYKWQQVLDYNDDHYMPAEKGKLLSKQGLRKVLCPIVTKDT